LQVVTPQLLTEDHDAWVEAKNRGLESLSVHKLLSGIVQDERLPAEALQLISNDSQVPVADEGAGQLE